MFDQVGRSLLLRHPSRPFTGGCGGPAANCFSLDGGDVLPLLFLLCLSFLGGVAASGSCRPCGLAAWVLLGGAAAVLGGLAAPARAERVAVACLAAVVGLAGCLYAGLHVRLAPGPLAAHEDRLVTLEGVVARDPEPRDGRLAVVVRATAIREGETRSPARGLVRLKLEDSPTLTPGDRVVVRGTLRRPPRAGNPGEFDARLYYAARGVHWFLHPARGAPLEIHPGGPAPARLLSRARAAIRRGIEAAFTPPVAAFYRAITLGDPADEEVPAAAFRRAGVAHLLAISGLHVGFVTAGAAALARRLSVRPLTGNILVSLVTVLYVALTGARASAVRAGVMAVAAAWAVPLGRRHDPLAAVGLAALLIVLVAPASLRDAGFQLSFAATLGLLTLAGPLRKRLPSFPGRRVVVLTTAAQLGVLPLLAYHGYELAPLGLLANLVLVPLAGVAVPLGLIGGLVGGLAPSPVMTALAGLASAPAGLLIEGVGWFARLPPGPVRLPAPPPTVVAGLCLGLVTAAARSRRLPILLLAVLLVWYGALAVPAGLLEIVLIDVGQGDSILIRSPSGVTALVDGGGVSRAVILAGMSDPGERVVNLLGRLGVRRVDYLLLTHPHADHAGGLVAVAAGLRVGLLLESGPAADAAAEYLDLLEVAERQGIPRRFLKAGDRVGLGRGRAGEVVLEALAPGPGNGHRPANDRSLVLVVRYGQTAFLLMGDAGAEVERDLLAAGVNLAADLLKVGHHGGEGGTGRDFLAAVKPAHAVISCGRHNPFGHPAPGVVARLEESGAGVWRTDLHGAVRVQSDGRRVKVSANVSPEEVPAAGGAKPAPYPLPGQGVTAWISSGNSRSPWSASPES